MKFRIFGTEFEISFLFTAMLSVMIAFDKTGEIYLFFLAATIHESAHFLTLCFFGCRPKAVRLIPGGINIVDNSPKLLFADILILISGPFANLICFFLFKGNFSLINLLLFVYNILPFDRLDGGSILWLTVGHFFGVKKADSVIIYTTLVAAGLLISGFFCLLYMGIPNYSLLIFSLYLFSGVVFKKVVERKS